VIAEIHNKISSSGSNLHDRLEDQLTGDIFGTLRYVPFEEGMAHLLSAIKFSLLDEEIKLRISAATQDLRWGNAEIEFWPRCKEGEPDVMLCSDDTAVCIEVKYHSALSDGIDRSDSGGGTGNADRVDSGGDAGNIDAEAQTEERKPSQKQLARESRMLTAELKYKNKKNKILLLIAKKDYCMRVYEGMQNPDEPEQTIAEGVLFGYISWHDILKTFSALPAAKNHPPECIVQDIVDLLTKKGFDGFDSFLRDHFDCGKETIQKDLLWELKLVEAISFNFTTNISIRGELFYEL